MLKRYKSIRYIMIAVMICFFTFWGTASVEAASTKTVTGVCYYDDAYDVLELVNEQRSKNGMSELTMDKDLLAAAMLRAAECTVLFDHSRPNGTKAFTVCDKMFGENIAYGFTSATGVMNGWMNSSGHKKNILNKGYKSIGIACFYKDGIKYWVQCFGLDKANKVTQPSNSKKTYKVALSSGTETKLVTSSSTTNPLKTKVANVKVTAGKKKLILTWKKKSGIDGYQIQVSTSKTFKTKQSYTIGKKTTKKTITKYKGKKLKSKKRYYIRIRAYTKSTASDGTVTKKYSKWKTVNKKTK